MHRKTGANCGSHRFFNDVHRPARTSELGCVLHSALFYSRNFGRNTNDHAWFVPLAGVHFLNEKAQHLFAHIEVGNDTIFKWAHKANVLRSSTPHALGLKTDGNQLTSTTVYCCGTWLVQNDAFTFDIHQRVCGTQVDGDITPQRK